MFIRRNRARSLFPSYFYRYDFLRKKSPRLVRAQHAADSSMQMHPGLA